MLPCTYIGGDLMGRGLEIVGFVMGAVSSLCILLFSM